MENQSGQNTKAGCCAPDCCNEVAEPSDVVGTTPGELKNLVRVKYGEIAEADSNCCGTNSCCGVAETTSPDFTIFAEDYSKLEGYNSEADLKLGCGVPTEFAQIKEGDVVVDLGSGAGNDAFVARAIAGEKGRVIGIDMTEPMIVKARKNAEKLQLNNVEFRLGEIEAMPLEDNIADVIISNCVLNLVPNKTKAFAEVYRTLKPGAHFSISDVVLSRPLPEGLRKAAEMYAGCVSGASLKNEYIGIIEAQGFKNVKVQIEKPISVPDDVLGKYLGENEIELLKTDEPMILSITVYGEKPSDAQ